MGNYMKPEDQWSCKRSPEIATYVHVPISCLNIMENSPSKGVGDAWGHFAFIIN